VGNFSHFKGIGVEKPDIYTHTHIPESWSGDGLFGCGAKGRAGGFGFGTDLSCGAASGDGA
jgi:hypothetical protein